MPPLSPRMQQLQGGMSQGPDQATSLFESGLSEMAYQLLTQRVPDLVSDVVTFKVLATDVDKGYGVGAFVVSKGQQPIYIPVIMSNSAIKPLDIMYHKALNMFLPLNKGWLDELDKAGLPALGTGIKTPETLYTDVDIRNIVVPPITGRFSYASADLDNVFSFSNLVKEGDAKEPTMLLPLLTTAPNIVKTAFRRILERNPSILKIAAEAYGVAALSTALRPHVEKMAAKQNFGGALWIADKDTTPSEFHRMFGDKAGEAYAGVRKNGYAVNDQRSIHNLMIKVQPYERWIEPNQPGVYVLYDSSSKEHPALVIPDPVDVMDHGTKYGRRPAVPGNNPVFLNGRSGVPRKEVSIGRVDESERATRRAWNAPKYLAVFGNGDYLETEKLVGRDSVADALSGALHKRLFTDVSGEPRAGKGFFVRQKGTTFQATVPIEIKSTTTGSDGVRRVKATTLGGFMNAKTLVTDPRNGYGTIWMPKDADIVYLPPDFVWIPLKECLPETGWFRSAMDLAGCVSSSLASTGARKIAIKDAGARQLSINGQLPVSKVAALRQIATDYAVKVADAVTLIEQAIKEGSASAWVAAPAQLNAAKTSLDKLAADEGNRPSKKKKQPDAGGPPEEEDPSLGAAAAQAAMGPPPAPPPPSPVELAAMEMDQAIQQQMQKLQDQQQMLSTLVQRSHEIAGGAPTSASVQTQAMGAPPPSANLATGQPTGLGMPGAPIDPSMEGMGGMQDPSASAMPMDPSMSMNAMQGGMPGEGLPGMPMGPSMSGMTDPSMGGPPSPGAMMPADGPNSNALASEVNPQFLQQAGALQPDVFDAAAVASLVQSPALHAVVGQHLPNLEKAVDNLARVLLTLWMQESDLKERVGDTTFDGLEQNLSSTFKSMGDIVLRLARGVQGAKDPEGHATP